MPEIGTEEYKLKLVVSNAINMVSEINAIIVDNARKGKPAEIQLPRIFDRAFMIHHESGVIPIVDVLSEE